MQSARCSATSTIYEGSKSAIRVVTIVLLLVCLGQVAYARETAISGQWVGGFSIGEEWTPIIVGFDDEGNGGYLVQDGRFSALIAVWLEASSVHFGVDSSRVYGYYILLARVKESGSVEQHGQQPIGEGKEEIRLKYRGLFGSPGVDIDRCQR